MVLKQLFPTPLWIEQLENMETLNVEYIAYLRKLRSEHAGHSRSNTLGWHSPDDLHVRAEFSTLSEQVMERVRAVIVPALELDDQGASLHISSMWAVINGKYAGNYLHRHGGSLFSGVYYLHTGTDSGRLRFHDPRADVRMLRPSVVRENEFLNHSHDILPQPGQLILFPAWLPHDVTPNLSDEERIVVAFNILEVSRKQPKLY